MEDGSCLLPGYPCDDNNPLSINDELSPNCECIGLLAGCTFSLACNYNPDASFDDGTCVFEGEACDDGNAATLNDIIDANCGCTGEIEVEGCVAIEKETFLIFCTPPFYCRNMQQTQVV